MIIKGYEIVFAGPGDPLTGSYTGGSTIVNTVPEADELVSMMQADGWECSVKEIEYLENT